MNPPYIVAGRTVAFSDFRQSLQRRGRVGFTPTSLLSHTMWHPEVFLILPFSFSLCQVNTIPQKYKN